MGDGSLPGDPGNHEWGPETLAIHAGTRRSGFDETSEALFLTSGYVYDTAEQAAATFAGELDRYRYTRNGNPTVTMLEERLAAIEGAEAAQTTASGMSAVFNAVAARVQTGDRVVAARAMFGPCFTVLDTILPRWGVHTDFVDGRDMTAWEQALSEPARLVFFETPSNPMQEIVDIPAVSELAHAAGALVVVDNVFATPVLQRPLECGADVVVYSTTKHMDGQGRTLGGAVLGSEAFIDDHLRPLIRATGPAMSPFTAWVVLKGLETLSLRVERQAATALELAGWLESQPGINWVRHPMLASHPQHDLAVRQMSAGGSIVTFEVEGGKNRAFEVVNRLDLIHISNNLGDAKSLVTHPATTTHHRLGAKIRATMGVTDGVIRLSVGLEDPDDLRHDLHQALTAG